MEKGKFFKSTFGIIEVVAGAGFSAEEGVQGFLGEVGDFFFTGIVFTAVGADIVFGGEEAIVMMAGAGDDSFKVGFVGAEGIATFKEVSFQRGITDDDHTTFRGICHKSLEELAADFFVTRELRAVPFAPGAEVTCFEEGDEMSIFFPKRSELFDMSCDDFGGGITVGLVVPSMTFVTV